jgi:hypothetical protein
MLNLSEEAQAFYASDYMAAALGHDPRQPGRFEGEPPETVYFWEAVLNGDGDGLDDSTVFRVNALEAYAFELARGDYYVVRERSDGFVVGESMTAADMEAWRADVEREQEEREQEEREPDPFDYYE